MRSETISQQIRGRWHSADFTTALGGTTDMAGPVIWLAPSRLTLTRNSATTIRVPALGGPNALFGGPKDIDEPRCLRLPLD